MNSIVNISMAPKSPSTCEAPVGATNPIPICSGVRGTARAIATNPIVVANANGIENQASPPMRKPLTADLGLSCYGSLPICLVNKDSAEVTHNINNSKY